MPSILCAGDEPALNRSRAAVLRTTGCNVTECASSGALLLLHNHAYDLVLLCHTIAAEVAANIIRAARRLPNPLRVIVIDSPFGSHGPAPEGVERMDPFDGPRLLAEKVCRSLDMPAPAHSAAPAKPRAAAVPITGAKRDRRVSGPVPRTH